MITEQDKQIYKEFKNSLEDNYNSFISGLIDNSAKQNILIVYKELENYFKTEIGLNGVYTLILEDIKQAIKEEEINKEVLK